MYDENKSFNIDGSGNSYSFKMEPQGAPQQSYPSHSSGGNSQQGPEHPRKSKKHFARLVAVALVFSLLGGVAGGSLVNFIGSDNSKVEPTPIYSGITHTSSTEQPSVTGNELSSEEIYAIGSSSTVFISITVPTNTYFGQSYGTVSGSGFIITSDGYIITNYHVVEEAVSNSLEINVLTYSGDEYVAKYIGGDEDNDVALIKIDGSDLVPVVLGNSDDLVIGNSVYAIGNPLGQLTFTMTSGIVSALERDLQIELESGGYTTISMFQMDAAVNSGNSGGPVFNSRGEVVGIVSAKYSSLGVEGLGFAIPINNVMPLIEDIMEYGYIKDRPYFGITVISVTENIANYYGMVIGAYINDIEEDSCCYEAGIRKGDIITKLGDTEITSSDDLINAKKDYKAGDTATLTVYRSGEYLNFDVVLDEQVG